MSDSAKYQRPATLEELRGAVIELGEVLVDLLDRGVVSGWRERQRIGTMPALALAQRERERRQS